MNTYNLKQQAKDKLSGKWMMAIIGSIIYLLISGQLFQAGYTREFANNVEVRTNFSNLIQLILMGPASLGFIIFMTRLGNTEGEYGDLFIGFKRFGDTFLYNLITGIIIFIGLILFIVPGIIGALTYSMGYLIMRDNPNVSATEAMRMSKDLMDGHKMEYFSFCLSFFGWFLLGIITLGLGFLYLHPYFTAAKIEYYEAISGKRDNPTNMSDDYEYMDF